MGASGLAAATRRVESRKDLPGPRALQLFNRTWALRLVNRFRQLRAIDLAAGLFPDREFKAALSAAQRLTKSLVAQRMLHRYRSLSGQTYYGLGEAGARWLRQNGNEADGDASASASRVSEKVNPEHDLWAAFIVLSCEARGLWARTEKELLPTLFEKKNDFHNRRQVLVVSDERDALKGLLPDAVAQTSKGVIWFEVDRSERGSGRLADLLMLMKCFRTPLFLGSEQRHEGLPLMQVVVLCKTERILRRHASYLTGVNPKTRKLRLHLNGGEPALRQVAPGAFDVMKDVEKRHADRRVALAPKVVGRVHFLLLPTWLSGFSYRPGARQDGWFNDGYLPFKNEPIGWKPGSLSLGRRA